MKNLVLLTAMLACVGQTNTAFAQQYDFSEMTCAAFLQNGADTKGYGYLVYRSLYRRRAKPSHGLDLDRRFPKQAVHVLQGATKFSYCHCSRRYLG
jgi:hypothetical protein